MPIPDSQSLLLPALQALAGGAETPISEIRRRIAEAKGLTPQDVRELLPNSGHPVFANRVSWMMLHLERAGLVEKVRRGVWRVSVEGERLLAETPVRIDRETLRNYPAYVAWRTGESAGSNDAASVLSENSAGTPEEALHLAVEQLRGALAADVLGRVRKVTPAFFERIIVDLLLAMGYGGGNPMMGRVTGRSGDGGIDGTIKEDALGLDEIYVQAKRYANGKTVGESDLRNFAGALDAAGTTKGVFVTTAGFTRAAEEYVARSPKRIVLIDGEELAGLMVKYNIGVRVRLYREIKWIDEDYFEQDLGGGRLQ